VAAFVAIAALGSLACGELLGLKELHMFDDGPDGSATGSEGGHDSGNVSDSPQGDSDPGSMDAGSDGSMDGTDACGPVPGNLLADNNADFELGCAGWILNGGTLTPSAQAHCGSMACQLCPLPATYDTVYTAVNIPVFQGEQYELRAFVRAVGDPFSAWGVIQFNAGQASGSMTALSGEYNSLSPALVTITTQTNIVNLQVQMGRGDGGCLLLDDVVLLRVRDAGGD
jgi:hypothetical protein